MRNKLKTICCWMLAVLCMASFSITAFASGGDEASTVPDAETATTRRKTSKFRTATSSTRTETSLSQ